MLESFWKFLVSHPYSSGLRCLGPGVGIGGLQYSSAKSTG